MKPRARLSSTLPIALLGAVLALAACSAPTAVPSPTPLLTNTAAPAATLEPTGSPTPVPTGAQPTAAPLPPTPTATAVPPSPTATTVPASATPVPPTVTRQVAQQLAPTATATRPPARTTSAATAPAGTRVAQSGRTPIAPPLPLQPGATPTAPCLRLPVRGFGQVWNDQALARDLVGCASYADEKGMQFEAQRFDHGVMIWVSADMWDNKKVVWVLFADDNSYSRVPDNWSPGEVEPAPTGVPEGRQTPAGRLGKAWREGAGVRDRLGWAVEAPSPGSGAYQEFDRGLMFWMPLKTAAGEERWIYVLSRYFACPPCGPRVKWAAYRDTWQ